MEQVTWTMGFSIAGILLGAIALHWLPRLGGLGKSMSRACCRAPMLDLVITWFTVAPWLAGVIIFGWRGLIGGVAGQVVGLTLWSWGHELVNLRAKKGPRIVKVLNVVVGRWRNHAALWATTLAVPVFWVVRVTELVAYPLLIWLVRFPKYKQSEWVNLSRQKFDGLVGHDLIWCLYCDWMTGVWSLGSEMLRNVESFWCPIRFSDTNKCENCKIDFPDVHTDWVASDGSMKDVAALLKAKYENADERNAWFGHPGRKDDPVGLTIEGESVED